MNKPPIVVVDSDAIIAQTRHDDLHHKTAESITNRLLTLHTRFIYPATAIAEAATHMQRALSNSQGAYNTIQFMTNPKVQIAEINQQTFAKALQYFSSKISKKITIFDCIVAAIAKERKADAIFSFDKFYKKNGFKLATEL